MKNEIKNLRNEIVLIVLLLIGLSSTSFAQFGKTPKALVSTDEKFMRAGMGNVLSIVAQQENPVSLDQVSATFMKGGSESEPIKILQEGGYYIINPDTIGIVQINIKVGDSIESQFFRVKEIDATGYISNFDAYGNEKVSVGIFKVQLGISIYMCCDLNASCRIMDFQILRISKLNIVERVVNTGAAFQEDTKNLINKAESGDIYIFRKIRYKCVGTANPQWLDNMIVELE